ERQHHSSGPIRKCRSQMALAMSVENPDTANHIVELIALESSIEAKAEPGEDRRAQDRLKDVVAECHLSNGAQTRHQPRQRVSLTQKHQQSEMAHRYR